MKKIGIINIGVSNINSISKMIRSLGFSSQEITSAEHFKAAYDKIIFPGVGNFKFVMQQLEKMNIAENIQSFCNSGNHFLGICLGMQLLFEKGYEGGETKGLNIIPGKVVKMEPISDQEKIPHNGWNELSFSNTDPIYQNIKNHSDFYFNHTYIAKTENKYVIGTTPYAGNITSSVRIKNVWGVQFHPEKSQLNGQKIIKNFLEFND